MTVPLHQWSTAASTTIKWMPPDSQDAYQKNLADPKSQKLLELFGWLNVDIDYRFNNDGYRTDEFDTRPNWIALGCSFTQGTGVRESERWTDVVADQLGISCWNLGVAGASGDTCYRIAKHYIPKLRPQFVVYLEPRYNRAELTTEKYPAPLVLNWAYDYKNWDGPYVKELLLNEINLEIAAEKNREAIRSICLQHSIPLIVYQPDAYIALVTDQKQHDLGRDLLHPGRVNNRAFAQVVAKDIEKIC